MTINSSPTQPVNTLSHGTTFQDSDKDNIVASVVVSITHSSGTTACDGFGLPKHDYYHFQYKYRGNKHISR
jgi:hypothetical protein